MSSAIVACCQLDLASLYYFVRTAAADLVIAVSLSEA